MDKMSRIKFNLPEKFIFETTIPIQIGNINYGGHLANDAVLKLVHEARMRFLSRYGYCEKNIEDTSLIMTDAAIQYKSEAYYGDRLFIKIAIEDITRIGFNIFYAINNLESGKQVAIVKTGMAFYNYNLHKIEGTPQAFIDKFSS